MASENETVADIIAEMRRGTKLQGYWRSSDLNEILIYNADRIEAAWNRERAEIEQSALSCGALVERSRRKPVGNSAAMREALMRIKHLFRDINLCEDTLGNEAYAIADAALSAPPRNCDRFKTREEARAYFDNIVCQRSNGSGSIECKGCHLDSIDNPHRADCRESWLFAPAEKGADA